MKRYKKRIFDEILHEELGGKELIEKGAATLKKLTHFDTRSSANDIFIQVRGSPL